MVLHEYIIEYDKFDDYYFIIPTGDWHLGAKKFDRQKWLNMVQKAAKNDRVHLLLMGDLGDCIVYSDKRFDSKVIESSYYNEEDLADLAGKQYREIRDALMPCKGRIIGIIEGNHEKKMRKQYYRDLTLDLCRDLETTFLSSVCMIRLVFQKKRKNPRQNRNEQIQESLKYIIFATHGSSGSTTIGGKVNYVESLARSHEADFYFVGHTHEKMIWNSRMKTGITKTGKLKRTEIRRIMALTGSFYKLYDDGASDYAEDKLYEAIQTGAVGLKIYPAKERIEIYSDIIDML